jgi:quercetin dioxygenase-like cupin family protein
MKLRSIALAVISFGLGAAALFVVETRTSWLVRFQRHTDYRVANTLTMPWVRGREENVVYDMKYLYKDPVTHEVAMLLRYPAGQVNSDHVHSHGHAMYVLEGELVTHRGTYGPGNFVWFPPNEVVSHGASPRQDVLVFFIRHEDMVTEHVRAVPH